MSNKYTHSTFLSSTYLTYTHSIYITFLSPTHVPFLYFFSFFVSHIHALCLSSFLSLSNTYTYSVYISFLSMSNTYTYEYLSFLSMTNTHSFFPSFCLLTPVKWVKMFEKKIDDFTGFRRYVRNRKLVGVGHFAKPIASTKYFDLFASRLRRRWKCSTKSALQQRRKRPLGVELFFFAADDEA